MIEANSGLENFMKAIFSLAMLSVLLAGCISSSNPPPPARNTTVVVPPGSTVICPNGGSSC
jgi:hypothetical protein